VRKSSTESTTSARSTGSAEARRRIQSFMLDQWDEALATESGEPTSNDGGAWSNHQSINPEWDVVQLGVDWSSPPSRRPRRGAVSAKPACRDVRGSQSQPQNDGAREATEALRSLLGISTGGPAPVRAKGVMVVPVSPVRAASGRRSNTV
jgi:hypothetical protein